MDYKAAYEAEVTRRVQAEKALDEKTREVDTSLNMIRYQFASIATQKRGLELLLNMAQMAELRLEREAVLKVFMDAVGQLIDACYGIVFLRRKKQEGGMLVASSSISYLPLEEYSDSILAMLSSKREFVANSSIGKMVEEGTNVIEVKKHFLNQDNEEMPDWLVYFPVRKNGELEAVAEFGVKGWTKESENYLALSMAAASQIGVMLERSAAHRKLEKNYSAIKEAHDQLKEAQSQLVQSEKMASIGQLAAGVAHEINNPVGFVMSNIDTLQDYLKIFMAIYNDYEQLALVGVGESENTRQIMERIDATKRKHDFAFVVDDIDQVIKDSSDGLSRVKDIVMSLKNFARADSGEFSDMVVDDVINDAVKMIWNELKYHVELVKQLDAPRPIKGNPAQISQVVVNLIINAAQAIEERGTIIVSTEQGSGFTRICIEDDGCGIPPSVVSKIFDPFYTTKPVDVGTGLGLSISHGIIEKHGGTIEVKSELGKGTCFSIVLPN